MRTIKILIAATEELHNEKIQFQTLIEQLNIALVSRGIKLERIKWDPENDGTIEDFKDKICQCEMCLSLYWRELASNSESELRVAYQSLKEGSNPRNLYIFFKESSDEVSNALQDFKANFVNEYGHFFCKFENVDTMNLQFILQFEAYQSQLNGDSDKLITIGDGKVKVGNKDVVNLDNVPFAALNKEYQNLHSEIIELDRQLAATRAQYIADPENNNLFMLCVTLANKKKEVAEKYDNYQIHLFNIALNFAKQSANNLSERMRRAREEFEKGNTIEADHILDMETMKQDAEKELKYYEQHRHNLELTIEEFLMKPDIVMANMELPLTERVKTACEAYEQALLIANTIVSGTIKLAKIYHDYGQFLQLCSNNITKALSLQQKALIIYRKLAESNPKDYLSEIAGILNNIALLQVDLQIYDEAEKNHTESLSIRKLLAEHNPDVLLKVVGSLNNLANLRRLLNRHEEAKEHFLEAISILNKFEHDKNDEYWAHIATTLHNLSALQTDLREYDEAENNLNKAIDITHRLVEEDPNNGETTSNLADMLCNLAGIYRSLHHYEDAEGIYKEVLPIREMLAKESPDMYLPSLSSTLYNYSLLLDDMDNYPESELKCSAAIDIQRQLSVVAPSKYSTILADMLASLAITQCKQNKYAEAEQLFFESINIFKRFAEVHPDVHEPAYAKALYNLANLQRMTHNLEESLKTHVSVLDIQLRLVQNSPDTHLPDLAFTYNNLAMVQAEMGRYEDAEHNCLLALEIREKLVEECPEKFLPYLAYTLQLLVKVERLLEKDEEAEEYNSQLMYVSQFI